MFIDTHAHLNFLSFQKDFPEVISRALANKIWIINIGTNLLTSQKAISIAQNYKKGVYASVGLHPLNFETGFLKAKRDPREDGGNSLERKFDYEKYKELAKKEKVVAIGEIGLDYYYRPKTKRKLKLFKEKQKELFLRQIKLAQELNLSLLLHCRMAHQDLLAILEAKRRKFRGVIHSFVGSLADLRRYLRLGFCIGFNGIIFKKMEGINFQQLIVETPLERILLETDSPYLPPPQAGGKRNEPRFIEYIAREIAKIKNLSLEKIAEVTTQNAKELFLIE